MFAFLPKAKIKVSLRQAVASNTPPGWNGICQGLFFCSFVGAIIDRPEHVPLTNLGRIVQQSIEDISKHYPMISVDHYVIMPNHVHLLLQINTDPDGRSMIAPTISTVARLMKGAVSRQAGFTVWQKGFYDHVIRNDNDHQDIWNYIEGNPSKWAEDKLYTCTR